MFELSYSFRNTTTSQIDSHSELSKRVEKIIDQFSAERENTYDRLAEIKSFLNQNIALLKNNWQS